MSWILKVQDKFQAAHFLREYQGKCEKVHGHSFRIEVEIEITELDKTGIGIGNDNIVPTCANQRGIARKRD